MILAYILLALAALVIIFVAVVASRPSDFKITRSARMSAPASAVFDQVNDFHNWEEWSPWAKLDPACRNTFDGPRAGKGAGFAWSGNKKVGEGRMTITDSRPSDLIRINLEFFRPFKATNTAEFTFNPQGNQTTVTWSMSGNANFISKAFGLFVNCDKMIGKEFEKGLASMKSIVERADSQVVVPSA